MTRLKIYTNHSDKLIVTINLDQLIKDHNIDPRSDSFDHQFETELLPDVLFNECLHPDHVWYELS